MDGDTARPSDNPSTPRQDEVIRPQTSETPAPDVPTFTADQTLAATDDTLPDAVTWTASEFIAHEKTSSWYALLTLGAVVAAAVVWLFTRDAFPTAGVFIGMVLLAYYASRQPRQQHYRLDASGLTIGERHLPYQEFRSFAVVPEGAFLSIELTPLRRFAMYTAIYLDPKDEDRILGYLSAHLPMAEPRKSLADDLMRRIHF